MPARLCVCVYDIHFLADVSCIEDLQSNRLAWQSSDYDVTTTAANALDGDWSKLAKTHVERWPFWAMELEEAMLVYSITIFHQASCAYLSHIIIAIAFVAWIILERLVVVVLVGRGGIVLHSKCTESYMEFPIIYVLDKQLATPISTKILQAEPQISWQYWYNCHSSTNFILPESFTAFAVGVGQWPVYSPMDISHEKSVIECGVTFDIPLYPLRSAVYTCPVNTGGRYIYIYGKNASLTLLAIIVTGKWWLVTCRFPKCKREIRKYEHHLMSFSSMKSTRGLGY